MGVLGYTAGMRSVRPAETVVEMTQIVLPQFTNNHGTVFGGQIAAWADICAAVSAQRFARGPVVTASMDQLHFLAPVRKGMVLVMRSMVNQAWRTSLEVGVRVDAEDVATGTLEHCCSAYFTFVALDPEGRPRAVPVMDLVGDVAGLQRAEDAELRRRMRLEMRQLRRDRR